MGIAAIAWPALIITALVAAPRAAIGQDSLSVSQSEYQGWKVYHTYCDRCHGQDAVGSTLAPNLRRSVGTMSRDQFIQKVTDGIVDKGMPAWKGVLTTEQITNIWDYLRARGSGRLAPGRPHVAS
jgi:cytochrome c